MVKKLAPFSRWQPNTGGKPSPDASSVVPVTLELIPLGAGVAGVQYLHFCDNPNQVARRNSAVENQSNQTMTTLIDRLPLRREQTVVRTLHPKDLERFHQYRANEDLAKFQSWTPMTADEALAFLQTASTTTDLIPGEWLQLGIADGATDDLIGDVGLFLAHDALSAEIGFTLSHQSHGQGHATRAVRMALELVLTSSSATEIRTITDARNVPSIRVLERAGFQFASQQQAIFKGEACTELVYLYCRNDA